MVLKDKYAQWTYLESSGHVALRNVTKTVFRRIKSVEKWDVVLPRSGNGGCAYGEIDED